MDYTGRLAIGNRVWTVDSRTAWNSPLTSGATACTIEVKVKLK